LSGNSWQSDSTPHRADLENGRSSRLEWATFGILAACALAFAACDVPSRETPQSGSQLASAGAKVAPDSSAPKTTPPSAAKSEAPKIDSMVTASAATNLPTVRAGDTFTIRVEAHIDSGWHIYAIDRPTGPSIPTTLEFKLPRALAWEGEWTGPEPKLDEANPQEPSFVYQGTVSFTRRVRVTGEAPPSVVNLRGTMRYQACDKFSCRAPTSVPLQTTITVVP
jgi:DsbC/DsbD-like thiol-disulfide interchange protein